MGLFRKSIAVGTNSAQVKLFDVERMRMIRGMKGHLARVSSLSWNNNLLSSGSRDSMIFNHDIRATTHHQATLQGHRQEVCGLKWSPDGKQLASGGNDNLLNIWDHGRTTARLTFSNHCAAVKALAWCPFRSNLLASGGGTADRTIRFWNSSSGCVLCKIAALSALCSLSDTTVLAVRCGTPSTPSHKCARLSGHGMRKSWCPHMGSHITSSRSGSTRQWCVARPIACPSAACCHALLGFGSDLKSLMHPWRR